MKGNKKHGKAVKRMKKADLIFLVSRASQLVKKICPQENLHIWIIQWAELIGAESCHPKSRDVSINSRQAELKKSGAPE